MKTRSGWKVNAKWVIVAHPSRNPMATKKLGLLEIFAKLQEANVMYWWALNGVQTKKWKKNLLGEVEHVAWDSGTDQFFMCGRDGRGDGLGNFQKKKIVHKNIPKKKDVQAVGKKLSKCSLLSLILILDDKKKNSCRIYCPATSHAGPKLCEKEFMPQKIV